MWRVAVRDVLWLILFPLALVALLVSRRFGDRIQALLMLGLGCLVVCASAWELAVDPWAWDWLFVATGFFAIGLGSTSLARLRRRPPRL